jgi:serine protease
MSSQQSAMVAGELIAKPRSQHAGGGGGRFPVAMSDGGTVLVRLPAFSQQRAEEIRTLARAGAAGRSVRHATAGLSQGTLATLDTLDYARLLESTGQFEYVVPNRLHRPLQSTKLVGAYPSDDQYYAWQRWHFDQMGAPRAMGSLVAMSAQPTRRPIVAVIDSGVALDHPDIKNQLVPGYDFAAGVASGDDTSKSSSFHGTQVSGVIGAEAFNGIYGASVAPMSLVMPLRTGDSSHTEFNIVQAMRFAAGLSNASGRLPERRADIVNISLGSTSECSRAFQDAVAAVRAEGVIVVAASGNNGTSSSLGTVHSPARCPSVIAVGATNNQKGRAAYSSGGAQLRVVAPGGDGTSSADYIWTTTAVYQGNKRNPSFGGVAGTSFAAPHVAGVLALMRWVNPEITPREVDALIEAGHIVDDLGDPGRDDATGFGLINAEKAVLEAQASLGAVASSVIEATPTSLTLGALRTEFEFQLQRVGTTSDRVSSLSVSSVLPVITVTPKSGQVDADGLGTYVVRVDRDVLPMGSTVYPEVIATTTLGRTLRIQVGIDRRGAGSPAGNFGRISVIAIDGNDSNRIVGGPVAVDPVGIAGSSYTYSLTAAGKSVKVIAGTDIDGDRRLCGPGEGCGVLGTLISPSELSSQNFSIDPKGRAIESQPPAMP